MVPAPIERSELPGHRQQIGKSAALTVGALCPRSLSAAAAADRKDQRNLAALTKLCCPHARARGGADSSALGQQTDLLTGSGRLGGAAAALGQQTDLDRLGPAGRRCGCWPTSPFLFSLASACADPRGMKRV